jgi:serine/threonine protein kinase
MATNPPPAAPPGTASASVGTGPDDAAGSLRHQITLRYDTSEWPGVTSASTLLEQQQLQTRYQISNEIGRGGMGVILRVVDRTLNRPVAMKVILKEKNETHRLRFIEEAQITGQLEHPGIVPVHDIGIDPRGNLFFTMKLVNGVSLAEVFRLLRTGDLAAARDYTLIRLLGILVDMSHAVAFAHHRGVIHRDLKPDNVMVGRYGEVQVMDWGLAKVVEHRNTPDAGGPPQAPMSVPTAVDREPPIASSRDDAMKTLFGTIVGTPAYMPPEQASGDPSAISYSSDIYSLGAVLYEVLTLTPPARGDSTADIVACVLSGDIDAPDRRAPARSIPGELSAIAMKALRTDPQRRYSSVEEFRADIELFLEGRAVSAKTDTPWETVSKLVRRNRGASAAIVIAGAVIIAVVATAFAMTLDDRRRAEREKRLALDAQATTMESLANLRKEQAETEREHLRRMDTERQAIPGLILQARAAIDRDRYDEATRTVDLALAIDGHLTEALLLRSQIAMAERAWSVATARLWDYLTLLPSDRDAQQLYDLCRSQASGVESPTQDAAIAAVLKRQGASHIATSLVGDFSQRVEVVRQTLEHAWPGARYHLDLTPNHDLAFDAHTFSATVTDLSPLRGVPLTSLDLSDGARIADLSPLAGMPLRHLTLRNCMRIRDFSVLKGMPLQSLDLTECSTFADLSLLAGMPLHELSLRACGRITDFAPLAAMPLVRLNVSASSFADLNIIAQIPTLRALYFPQSRVKDVTPLASMPLTEVELDRDPRLLGFKLLRAHPTVATINLLPAAEFWRRLDRDRTVPAGR